MLRVRVSRSWVVPLMAVEHAPSGVGAVFFKYQLPVWPESVSLAVVSATLDAASVRVVKLTEASSVEQVASLYAL